MSSSPTWSVYRRDALPLPVDRRRPAAPFAALPDALRAARPPDALVARPTTAFAARPAVGLADRPVAVFTARPAPTFAALPAAAFFVRRPAAFAVVLRVTGFAARERDGAAAALAGLATAGRRRAFAGADRWLAAGCRPAAASL